MGYKPIFLDDNNPQAAGKCADFTKYKVPTIPAFGDNELRLSWCKKIKAAGVELPTLIHPTAYISPKAVIGEGCVVLPKACVNTDVEIDSGCIINLGAIIDHGCRIEEACHLCIGAIVKGENRIKRLSKVEAGEVIQVRQNMI